MRTFDVAEVNTFKANLIARLDRCDEGMECANLDAALQLYARICCDYRKEVRDWGRAVFAGRIAFDPEVERVLFEQGCQLHDRAFSMLSVGQEAEEHCFVLDGRTGLRSALWELDQLINGWVTPKPAVGPSFRSSMGGNLVFRDEARRRLQSLSSLPATWRPNDVAQQRQLDRLRQTAGK